jgi:hypothetical protein
MLRKVCLSLLLCLPLSGLNRLPYCCPTRHQPACFTAAIVGDITPKDGVSKEKKAQLEADAIRKIQSMLGADTPAGD